MRLIIADGGNREAGALKENRARDRLDRPDREESASDSRLGWAVTSDKKVRNIGRKMKQNKRTTSLGGRIAVSRTLSLVIVQNRELCPESSKRGSLGHKRKVGHRGRCPGQGIPGTRVNGGGTTQKRQDAI